MDTPLDYALTVLLIVALALLVRGTWLCIAVVKEMLAFRAIRLTLTSSSPRPKT